MPRCCVFCGTECVPAELFCCSDCAADLPWNEHQCLRCAEPLAPATVANVECGRCQQRPPPYIAAATPLVYMFPVDAAIKRMKFHRGLEYVPAFTPMLEAMLAKLPADIDALLPMPLHWRRHALRGFNQAAELCRPLSRRIGLPMLVNAQRVRFTPYQSGLDASQRRINLRAAFAIRGRLKARHVLIVDDVITTGETSRALAATLLQAGVGRVSVLAVARAGRVSPD